MALPALTPPWWSRWWELLTDRVRQLVGVPVPTPPGLWWPTPGPAATYAVLYRGQPHVRTVVDFLASQLGQLGIHVYRRLSDTDRVRVHDHPLARLLRAPNEGTTRYAWISQTVMDYAVFGDAFSIKVRRPNRLELYRVPPPAMQAFGDLVPRLYTWTLPDGNTRLLDPHEVFHLKQYNPDDPVAGLSPLETLRKLLAEEEASTQYREWFWKNAARLGGTIQRPKDAPRWTMEQRELFRAQWLDYSGPRNAGKTVVLEDGMSFEPNTATARDSQLIEARKLTREEVAAAYHVPPAMLGILEAQGYGSLREQHKALYQDTLGPYVSLLEGEIERQLLHGEFDDSDDVYVQFNINEKLQGSFEEETDALTSAVGSPYMARNEARARLNLPRVASPLFDIPVTRLDILEGQTAKAAQMPRPPVEPVTASEPLPLVVMPDPRQLETYEVLTTRLETALAAIPTAIANQLRAVLPRPETPPVQTRAVRDEAGRIVELEDRAADGALVARRLLIRDQSGRVVEIAQMPLEEPTCPV